MKQDQIEKHSTAQSVILHLSPGILVGAFYFLALKPVAKMGYPSFFAQFLAFAFILVPLELGFLLVQGKKIRYTCQTTPSFLAADFLNILSALPASYP